jgi:hypothetical protein
MMRLTHKKGRPVESQQFDRFVRSFGRARSRRSLLGALAASALGAAGLSQAEAGGGNSACAHFCQSIFPPGPQRGQCVSDAAHGTGLCAACGADPANYCDGACTDVRSDAHNCNRCGNACPGDPNGTATCVQGACQLTCDADYDICGGDCLNLQADPDNCGACGHACDAGEVCGAGRCGCGSYIIAGKAGATSTFDVDDDLEVSVDGVTVIDDHDHHMTTISPTAPFTSKPGSTIHIEAIDINPSCHYLTQMTLYCADGSASQPLAVSQQVCNFGQPAAGNFLSTNVTILI